MNRGKTLCLVAAAAASALAYAPRAEASLIQYDFTATITSGPLNGVVENGSFTYDNTGVVPGERVNAIALLDQVAFTLNGITYNAATANTGSLSFDAAGNLDMSGSVFGDNCVAGSCGAGEDSNQWYIGGSFLTYSTSTSSSVGSGSVTYTEVPVPEPGSLALLGTALLGFGLVGFTLRRRAARL